MLNESTVVSSNIYLNVHPSEQIVTSIVPTLLYTNPYNTDKIQVLSICINVKIIIVCLKKDPGSDTQVVYRVLTSLAN